MPEPMTQFRLAVCAVDRNEPVKGSIAAIAEAAALGADLVVLPEEPDVFTRSEEARKPEHTAVLSEHAVYQAYVTAAAELSIGVVGNLHARVDDGCANTSFLLDRQGKLCGTYHKKHPAPGEDICYGDGDSPFPILEFEGVRIGLAVCMDIHVPELFRIYGLRGADLVCLSTQYLDYTGDMLESIEKARAIDSQMYLGLSRYVAEPFLAGKDMGYAKVIGPDGRVLSSTGHRQGVAVATFDPRWRMPFWNAPETTLRELFDRVRQPLLYRPLVEPND